jgi:hypothetical protein
VASPFQEHGLTANLYLPRPAIRAQRRRTKRLTTIAVVLGFVGVLLLQMVPDAPGDDAASTQETTAEQGNNSYEFAVYILNHTVRAPTGDGTLFGFDSAQLPFDFSELVFGEFRGDTEFRDRYYAGFSLLARAEGPNASIRFLEADGKLVEQIGYQGQSLIVLNGWESISKDGKGKVIDHTWGSMQIAAYDWEEGSWSPEEGIAVEHPSEMTVTSASLCLMVYEPGGSTDIPEFGPGLACVALALLVLIVRRQRSSKRP